MLTYHVERPVLVDDDALVFDGCAVDVDNPEQRRDAGPRAHLAHQSHVLVADVCRRRVTIDYRTVCRRSPHKVFVSRCSHIDRTSVSLKLI